MLNFLQPGFARHEIDAAKFGTGFVSRHDQTFSASLSEALEVLTQSDDLSGLPSGPVVTRQCSRCFDPDVFTPDVKGHPAENRSQDLLANVLHRWNSQIIAIGAIEHRSFAPAFHGGE